MNDLGITFLIVVVTAVVFLFKIFNAMPKKNKKKLWKSLLKEIKNDAFNVSMLVLWVIMLSLSINGALWYIHAITPAIEASQAEQYKLLSQFLMTASGFSTAFIIYYLSKID